MIVACPSCGAGHAVPASKVSPQGTELTCRQCGAKVPVSLPRFDEVEEEVTRAADSPAPARIPRPQSMVRDLDDFTSADEGEEIDLGGLDDVPELLEAPSLADPAEQGAPLDAEFDDPFEERSGIDEVLDGSSFGSDLRQLQADESDVLLPADPLKPNVPASDLAALEPTLAGEAIPREELLSGRPLVSDVGASASPMGSPSLARMTAARAASVDLSLDPAESGGEADLQPVRRPGTSAADVAGQADLEPVRRPGTTAADVAAEADLEPVRRPGTTAADVAGQADLEPVRSPGATAADVAAEADLEPVRRPGAASSNGSAPGASRPAEEILGAAIGSGRPLRPSARPEADPTPVRTVAPKRKRPPEAARARPISTGLGVSDRPRAAASAVGADAALADALKGFVSETPNAGPPLRGAPAAQVFAKVGSTGLLDPDLAPESTRPTRPRSAGLPISVIAGAGLALVGLGLGIWIRGSSEPEPETALPAEVRPEPVLVSDALPEPPPAPAPRPTFDAPAPEGYAYVARNATVHAAIGTRTVARLEAGAQVRRLSAHEGWVLVLVEPAGPAGFVEADSLQRHQPLSALADELAFEGCGGPAASCRSHARREEQRCLERCPAGAERCPAACRLAREQCRAACGR